ncbi:MAG: hypothetical protein RIS09_190 [Actinomycetota bacterium]|jgi:cyanophycinase-like exopeptidase
MIGSIALVGSGEYLPEMMDLEASLLQDGLRNNKKARFIQIPTAAGQEGSSRLQYWKNLGLQQAKRLGVEQVFLPVFTRNDANDPALANLIEESALIYLSGGNPGYLADCLRGTLVGEALFQNWQQGSSLAGCSAGAMALCDRIVGFKMMNNGVEGLGFVSSMQVLPHFDRYFRWVPERAIGKLVQETKDATLVGIDENTALLRRNGQEWQVEGHAAVHIFYSRTATRFTHKEFVTFD